MSKPLLITDVEKRENEVVYWIGNDDDPRDFGVLFQGPIANIARQGIVESIILALGVCSDMAEGI